MTDGFSRTREGSGRVTPRVAVVGSGYVGTVAAACLAWLGREVVAVETDLARLNTLRLGVCPFYEPGLDAVLASAMASGRLRFTEGMGDALAGSDVVFLCVGTPPGADGHADMSAVRAAATAIGANLDGRHVVVTKSTVPIGTGRWLESRIEDAYTGSDPIEQVLAVVSCPEFLREGSAVADFLHPERLVLGGDDPLAIEEVVAVYEPVLNQLFPGGKPEALPVLVRTGLATAETVKYAANAFLATKISFINEMAAICELVAADVTEVASAIGLDSRIGAGFLGAGVGWGGSCFGKDLSELVATAADHGRDPVLLRATLEVNRAQRRQVLDKLRRHLKPLRGKRVALLGLAFKAGTDDLRDAPAVDIARWLIDAGARVTAHDPRVKAVPGLDELRLVAAVGQAVERCDAVVLLTEWPEYARIDWSELAPVMRGHVVLDGRNFLDPGAVAAAGLTYEGIGRAHPVGVVRSAPAGGAEDADDRANLDAPTHLPTVDQPTPAVTAPGRHVMTPTGAGGHTRDELRFLLYSHDGVGLGHFMRNLKVAHQLAASNDRVSVLLACGARVDVPMPPGVDRVSLPALRKVAPDLYLPRSLRTTESTLALRSDLLAATVESFRPHGVLVDRHPLGLGGEMARALEAAAARGTALALGLRDVLDSPEVVATEWPPDICERVGQLYDSVLVYGDRDWFDPISAYAWPETLADRVRFVGLVGGTSWEVPPEKTWHDRGESPAPERPYVAAAVGGGVDGARLLRTFLVAAGRRGWRGVAFTGPDMEVAERQELIAMGARAGIRVVEFEALIGPVLRRADVAVTMAGANTVGDLLESGCRSVLVPRTRPRQEQVMRARILEGLGRATVVLPEDLSAERLVVAVEQALELPPPDPMRLEGARRAAEILLGAVAGRRQLDRAARTGDMRKAV